MGASRRKTKAWLARHSRDTYVRKALAQGYRSRAAFKLVELDVSLGFLASARTVVDLGAAPGGWCQVARERCAQDAYIVGVDLVPITPLATVKFVQGDCTEPTVTASLLDGAKRPVDVVLCDAAPNISGFLERDDADFEHLHDAVLDYCVTQSARCLILKSFTGAPYDYARSRASEIFSTVGMRHLKSTKKHSRECYLFANKPQGPYN